MSHVNPLSGVWAGLPKLVLAGPRADWRAGVRIGGLKCGLKSRRADWRADACMSGPTCDMLGVICD